MEFLDRIKEEITNRTSPCTHANEAAGWFSRVESNGMMVIYTFDVNDVLQSKNYKTLNGFAKAIMNKCNRGY
tara:strand:+ start:281 stop:496 length:216 start_codon:yes stop_codon:yes gene_type:complete